ncbi:putative uroporphyrinogen decarboxylase, partial [Actinomyces naeslundii str. Howell 279]
ERARAGLQHSAGPAGWTPVLAFGGAPFTLAAYLVEGRPSRDHLAARTLMRSDPESWDRLMTWCARLTGEFIAIQVRAGAAAAQLFDSWAGSLSPRTYRERVAPYSGLALETARGALSPTTGQAAPLIHFGTGTARLLGLMRQGADAVGIDERIEFGEAIETLAQADPQAGPCPVQGNLDPALLAAPWPLVAEEVDAVLAAGRAAPGHVVNLGHGVPPATDADVLTRIVARVHGSADWEAVALAGWDAVAETRAGAGGGDDRGHRSLRRTRLGRGGAGGSRRAERQQAGPAGSGPACAAGTRWKAAGPHVASPRAGRSLNGWARAARRGPQDTGPAVGRTRRRRRDRGADSGLGPGARRAAAAAHRGARLHRRAGRGRADRRGADGPGSRGLRGARPGGHLDAGRARSAHRCPARSAPALPAAAGTGRRRGAVRLGPAPVSDDAYLGIPADPLAS